MGRVRALRLLWSWYRVPVGAAYLAVLAAAVIAGFVAGPGWALVVALPALAVVLPYKIYREGSIREERINQVAQDTRAATERSLDDAAQAQRAALAEISHDVAVRLRGVAAELAAVRRAIGELRNEQAAEQRAIRQAIAELEDGAGALREELQRGTAEAVAEMQRSMTDVEAKIRGAVEEVAARAEQLFRSEANARILSLARHQAASAQAGGAVVIVTPQRSGSTWLFDMLRCHPAVRFMPTGEIFAALGGTGRRYPVHLSDGPAAADHVEVQAGVGSVVPAYAPPRGWDRPPGSELLAIEKLHPMALGYDTAAFVDRVAALAGELPAGVRLVYLVRDPAGTVGSFVAYRRRSPDWHRDVSTEEVLDLYVRSYEMIAELVEACPGIVVTYADLQDPVAAMTRLYRWVDGSLDREAAEALARHAVAATGREERRSDQTGPFIAENPVPGPAADLGDDPAVQAALARCEELYAAISAARS